MNAQEELPKELQGERLLTIPTAARLLGIDPATLKKAIAAKQVRGIELSSVTKVPTAEVRRLLAASREVRN